MKGWGATRGSISPGQESEALLDESSRWILLTDPFGEPAEVRGCRSSLNCGRCRKSSKMTWESDEEGRPQRRPSFVCYALLSVPIAKLGREPGRQPHPNISPYEAGHR